MTQLGLAAFSMLSVSIKNTGIPIKSGGILMRCLDAFQCSSDDKCCGLCRVIKAEEMEILSDTASGLGKQSQLSPVMMTESMPSLIKLIRENLTQT